MFVREGFQAGWQQRGASDETARELQRPIHPATNPPELLELVPVRVLRPFCIAGKRLEVGGRVKLPRHDAASLAALGKAELVEQ